MALSTNPPPQSSSPLKRFDVTAKAAQGAKQTVFNKFFRDTPPLTDKEYSLFFGKQKQVAESLPEVKSFEEFKSLMAGVNSRLSPEQMALSLLYLLNQPQNKGLISDPKTRDYVNSLSNPQKELVLNGIPAKGGAAKAPVAQGLNQLTPAAPPQDTVVAGAKSGTVVINAENLSKDDLARVGSDQKIQIKFSETMSSGEIAAAFKNLNDYKSELQPKAQELKNIELELAGMAKDANNNSISLKISLGSSSLKKTEEALILLKQVSELSPQLTSGDPILAVMNRLTELESGKPPMDKVQREIVVEKLEARLSAIASNSVLKSVAEALIGKLADRSQKEIVRDEQYLLVGMILSRLDKRGEDVSGLIEKRAQNYGNGIMSISRQLLADGSSKLHQRFKAADAHSVVPKSVVQVSSSVLAQAKSTLGENAACVLQQFMNSNLEGLPIERSAECVLGVKLTKPGTAKKFFEFIVDTNEAKGALKNKDKDLKVATVDELTARLKALALKENATVVFTEKTMMQPTEASVAFLNAPKSNPADKTELSNADKIANGYALLEKDYATLTPQDRSCVDCLFQYFATFNSVTIKDFPEIQREYPSRDARRHNNSIVGYRGLGEVDQGTTDSILISKRKVQGEDGLEVCFGLALRASMTNTGAPKKDRMNAGGMANQGTSSAKTSDSEVHEELMAQQVRVVDSDALAGLNLQFDAKKGEFKIDGTVVLTKYVLNGETVYKVSKELKDKSSETQSDLLGRLKALFADHLTGEDVYVVPLPTAVYNKMIGNGATPKFSPNEDDSAEHQSDAFKKLDRHEQKIVLKAQSLFQNSLFKGMKVDTAYVGTTTNGYDRRPGFGATQSRYYTAFVEPQVLEGNALNAGSDAVGTVVGTLSSLAADMVKGEVAFTHIIMDASALVYHLESGNFTYAELSTKEKGALIDILKWCGYDHKETFGIPSQIYNARPMPQAGPIAATVVTASVPTAADESGAVLRVDQHKLAEQSAAEGASFKRRSPPAALMAAGASVSPTSIGGEMDRAQLSSVVVPALPVADSNPLTKSLSVNDMTVNVPVSKFGTFGRNTLRRQDADFVVDGSHHYDSSQSTHSSNSSLRSGEDGSASSGSSNSLNSSMPDSIQAMSKEGVTRTNPLADA